RADGRPLLFAQQNLADFGPDADPRDAALPIRLADGRAAAHRSSGPLIWNDRPLGAVVALRVDGEWDPSSESALRRASALVAVDLAETYELWSARQAAAANARRVRTLDEIRRDIAQADD